MTEFDSELDNKLILNKYRQLLKYSNITDVEKRKKIRKAFNLALDAHKTMRRKSGEPYIIHPLEVALICVKEIGLGSTSIICSLLHDVVEDTDYTLSDISHMFGNKVAKIIDGLTKISGIYEQTSTPQAETFRKILLTLSEDVRVILIKLADRLHNMRTLGSMSHEKIMKICSETQYIYAPLAHRLGLYAIKSELEDLVLMYKEPEAYELIKNKLADTEEDRKKLIAKFLIPVRKQLSLDGLNYRIETRVKAYSSIWSKMQNKGVVFEEVYDIFAIRIILDSPIETEKIDCWKTYSVIASNYVPKQDRFRDWLSVPKANGYEALHTTVMSKDGRWVEVQIRTKRMDEIAEKGYAAHWKYKENSKSESGIDEWLTKIREVLQSQNTDTLEFLDEIKLNLFSHEIYTFTPSGEMRTLPYGATVLDFAYSIHSHVGNTAIGAKINNQLVPLGRVINSGDQIEILNSSRQTPKEEWLNFVITARAKSQIKASLKEEKKLFLELGKEKLHNSFIKLKKDYTQQNIKDFQNYVNIPSDLDFYYKLATEKLDIDNLTAFFEEKDIETKSSWTNFFGVFNKKSKLKESLSSIIHQQLASNPDELLLGKATEEVNYMIATCCNPIPGDDVIGFHEGANIVIHRTNCKSATRVMSTHGHKIIKAKWREKGKVEFLAGISIEGYDKVGLLREITEVISSDLNVNIRSIQFEASEGLTWGKAMLYIQDTAHLTNLIDRLKKIPSLQKIQRIG